VDATLASLRRWRDEEYAVAVFQLGGFAVEEADVFFVEIDVEELADLALVVADVTGEGGEFSGQIVQSFGDRGGGGVYLWRASVKRRKAVGISIVIDMEYSNPFDAAVSPGGALNFCFFSHGSCGDRPKGRPLQGMAE